MIFSRSLPLLAAIAVVLPLVDAEDARACGGLFCSGLSPVDQNSEQVLFEIDEAGTVTATVEISYSGDPRAFSWIIPVHGTPDYVGVAPAELFRWLDAATQPRLVWPPYNYDNCDYDDYDDDAIDDGSEGEGEGEGVSVTKYPDVGPYDGIVVVEGRDPAELIAWLTEHGYLITDAMRPVIEEYAIENQKFLAMRLQPDVDVERIVPVRFHCPAPNPVVPSRLTSLAAEPHMGMVVTVLANQRYEPASWAEVQLNPDDITLDPNSGQTNYQSLVALRVDQAGGQAFVVERAGGSDLMAAPIQNQVDNFGVDEAGQAAADDLLALAERRPYMTRFYTRVSPEEMTVDPVFAPSSQGDVANILDLSGRAPVDACPAEPEPTTTACSFLYCGLGATCGLIERFDGDTFGDGGCRCTATQLARPISAPGGGGYGLDVACVEQNTNVADEATNATVCDGITCGGSGSCVPLNGIATCRCEEGTVARVDFYEGGGVTCVTPSQMRPLEDITAQPFEPRPALDPGSTRDSMPLLSCSATSVDGVLLVGGTLLSLIALPLAVRRNPHGRRRRTDEVPWAAV